MAELTDNKYIKHLKRRLREEPGTKLFLSFAEELRKHDLPEDAILTLVDGLRKAPDYFAARLTLGRWYMSMDMIPEARQQLGLVEDISPMALYAHKRLGLLNRRDGDVTGAAEEYRKALQIFPRDKESLEALEALGVEETEPPLEQSEGPGLSQAEAEIPGVEDLVAPDIIDWGLIPEGPPSLETPPLLLEEEEQVPFVPREESAGGPSASETVPVLTSVKEGLEEAERCLSEGVDRAMRIYDALLVSFPGDADVTAKREDLLAALRMLRRDRQAVAERLGRFLSAVQAGFGPPVNEPAVVLSRLNRFMEKVQLRFRASGDKKTVLENLNRFSEAIRSRFAEGSGLENPA